MKDIRLEVSPRVYSILLDFVKSYGLKTFGIKLKHQDNKRIITIYTDLPWLVIGRRGTTLQQLLDKIHENELDNNIEITLEEINFFIRDDNEPYTDKEYVDFVNDYMIARGF